MAKKTKRARKTGSVRGYYVASTHWDREWYEPFQHYRFRLMRVLGDVLDLLERTPAFKNFLLDGQTCVLEDYLEMRPEDEERIRRLVSAGRLEVGPWYVMPDEFLPSGESLVRNLIRGHQLAERFGGVCKCGFVCDIFGHNSQLPQILRLMDIDNAVVWRGAAFEKDRSLIQWRGADGSEVLTYVFEPRGYGQYFFEVRVPGTLPDGRLDLDVGIDGIDKVYELETARTPGKVILLFDSMDHHPAVPETTDLLAAAEKAGYDVCHASINDFFAAVRAQKCTLPRVTGELRYPGRLRDGHVIPGVLSSRILLKQRNAACESLLVHWAEPFAALATHLGAAYPDRFLDRAWKYLLLNHPHDSICGCSIDQVHRDMLYRFDQTQLIAGRVAQMSLRSVADRTRLPRLEGEEDVAVTVFNPTGAAIDETVEIPLYFNRNTKNRFQEWFGYEPIVGFRLFDERNREIPYQRLGVVKLKPYKTYDDLVGYHGSKREEVRVAARLKIPAHGWTTIVCKPTTERTRSRGTQRVAECAMENEHLHVQINVNGTLDVTERKTGSVYRGLLSFEERADIGDGWYHGTAVNDEWFTSIGSAADIALIHDGFAQTTYRIRVVMNVPECFERDRQLMHRSTRLVPMEITSHVTLRAGVPWLEVRTDVDNTARDHRLRVLFPSELDVETYFADSPYDVVERPITLMPDSYRLFEPELETKPQYSFTAVNNGQRGLAIVSSGQPESAVCDRADRPIALTLFRGFARTVAEEGELGGQMLGSTSHRMLIYPHAGRLPIATLCHLGTRAAAGVQCVYTEHGRQQLDLPKPTLKMTDAWLKPGNGPLVVTACKRSEDGAALILRLFNPTMRAAKQTLEFAWPIRSAHRANLLEKPQKKLAVQGKSIVVAARAKEIVTLRLVLK